MCKQHACCVHVGGILVSCSVHADVKNVVVAHVRSNMLVCLVCTC